jgi:GT2 family glycosyltransferase
MKVTAILTSHNRRERTLACLESYFRQETPSGVALDAVLVDDASSDGTAEAVRATRYPVLLVHGDGDLFWAAGMAEAERRAVAGEPAYLLWLNDDVVLDGTALRRLLDVASDSAIAVGALRDAAATTVTYSGVRRASRHPLDFALVAPKDEPLDADTFHGNVALVPRPVYLGVGGIDGGFAHAAADFDYGLRATALGFGVVVAPGTVGICDRDVAPRLWLANDSGSLSARLRFALSRKGVPPRSYARFLRRHGGWLWPAYFIGSYVRIGSELASLAVMTRVRRLRRLAIRGTA